MRKIFTSLSALLLLVLIAAPSSANWTTRDEPRLGFAGAQTSFESLDSFPAIGVRFQTPGFLTQLQLGTTEQGRAGSEYDWADVSLNAAPALNLSRYSQIVPYGGVGYTYFDQTTAPAGSSSAFGLNSGVEFRLLIPGRRQAPQFVVGSSYRMYSSDDLSVAGTTPNHQAQLYFALTFTL